MPKEEKRPRGKPNFQDFVDRMRQEKKLTEEEIKELSQLFTDAVVVGAKAALEVINKFRQ